MRRAARLGLWFVVTLAIAPAVGLPGGLYEERLLDLQLGSGEDLGARLAALIAETFGPRIGVMAVSLAVWLIAVAVLVLYPPFRRGGDLLFHPAALVLVMGGYGGVAVSLVALFSVLSRLDQSRRPQLVPALGGALLATALLLPRFELLFLALASPLFFVAPRRMLQEHMTSFYMITLMPAVVALALGSLFFGLSQNVDGTSPGLRLLTAPEAMFPVLLGFALGVSRRFRLTAALITMAAGFLVAPVMAGTWPILAASLAAAFALPEERAVSWHVVVGAGALAAAAVSLHMP